MSEGAWRSKYDEFALSGWLALSGARKVVEQEWGLTLSSIPTPEGDGWGLSIGRCTAEFFAASYSKKEKSMGILSVQKCRACISLMSDNIVVYSAWMQG